MNETGPQNLKRKPYRLMTWTFKKRKMVVEWKIIHDIPLIIQQPLTNLEVKLSSLLKNKKVELVKFHTALETSYSLNSYKGPFQGCGSNGSS